MSDGLHLLVTLMIVVVHTVMEMRALIHFTAPTVILRVMRANHIVVKFLMIGRQVMIVSRCEDYPCCGHIEDGISFCPDEEGRFYCAANCGTKLELNAKSSVCDNCLRNSYDDDPYDYDYDR